MAPSADTPGSSITINEARTPWAETTAVIVAALLGEYSLLIMPFIVTAMMQGYGLNELDAGNLVSVQLLTMGIAGILVSYSFRRVPARFIVTGAAIVIVGANALCAFGATNSTLVTGRSLTGLGEGSLMAAAGAIAAGVANPHRLFSLLGLVIAGVAAAALIVTPFLFDAVGPRGVFWLLACSPLAALATVRWLPKRAIVGDDVPKLGALRISGALPVLSAFALLWIGASALWVFAELIGAQQGLSLGQVGTCLAIAQVAGILGPLAAHRYGDRLGLPVSIAVGSAVMAVAGLVMIYGNGSLTYTAATSFLSIGSMFLAPCFRSLMARIDGAGSVVAMSVAFYTFGFGVAPALVAVLRPAGSGYGTVALLATAAFVVSGALVMLPQVRRR
jgi:predicted MFS family arabinose efflux permease